MINLKSMFWPWTLGLSYFFDAVGVETRALYRGFGANLSVKSRYVLISYSCATLACPETYSTFINSYFSFPAVL